MDTAITSKVLMEDYESFMDLCFASGSAVMVKGPPGCGKTQGQEQRARRLNEEYLADGGYGYFEMNLANTNIADIQGYNIPIPNDDTDWQGRPMKLQRSVMTYPFWAFDKFSGKPAYKFKRGVIVIEEYGQGGKDEKKAIQQLVEEKRLGGWTFEGFDVVLLSNRDIDRAGVGADFDHAINRRIEVELVPTLKATMVYGAKKGWSNLTLAFAARNEDILFNTKVPEKQGPWLTSRSLEKGDSVIRKAEAAGYDLKDTLVLTALAGAMGLGAAGRFVAFFDARSRIPTISAVLADPEGTPVPVEKDIMMFLVFDLASKTTVNNIDRVIRYIKRLPNDMATTYFNAATSRDKLLISSSAFSSFAIKNVTLLTAIEAKRRQLAAASN